LAINVRVLTWSFSAALPVNAGVVGRLLAGSQPLANGLSTHIPAFDRNGNGMELEAFDDCLSR